MELTDCLGVLQLMVALRLVGINGAAGEGIARFIIFRLGSSNECRGQQ